MAVKAREEAAAAKYDEEWDFNAISDESDLSEYEEEEDDDDDDDVDDGPDDEDDNVENDDDEDPPALNGEKKESGDSHSKP